MSKSSTNTRPARATSVDPALDPALIRRVVVERVRPRVDDGRFPIKRTTGEHVVVTADIFADGHDTLSAALLHRRVGDAEWTAIPMDPLGNDAWTAAFTVGAPGRYEYTVEGWIDRLATWRTELAKKAEAGHDVTSELLEVAVLVLSVAERADIESDRAALTQMARAMADTARGQEGRLELALSPALVVLSARHGDRRDATRYDRVLEVLVDRERARFGAWYEVFPRSAGTDPGRGATFAEAAALLPYIASMGFDVVYLPPIHPIGRSFRKGRNNALTAADGDPGSPWAIGSDAGGHTTVEPALGTIDDFGRFVDAARQHDLEIALDLAYQASPDHPYVREHPEWFRHRPDGTIKYAENPPKKYQDIYPLNFESHEWPALWHELKRVIEFWISHGVRIFRVDNPHTKPFRFWRWALSAIRDREPDVIFLSEAFTRPKIMRHLAKCGFSQSYTYFTWRNRRAELEEYFTELTQTRVREYMRANLFTNTPDILHEYLQLGGRPAFQARFVLAATLGASYGIYSGFELVENTPVRTGSEEYLDSEKYQIRIRTFDHPDSLAPLITQVNAIRRAHPALQRDWGLRFHATDNPEILCYSKLSEDGADLLVMVVNLDPFHMQHGFVRLPIASWNLKPDGQFEVLDLLSHERYVWRGERNYVRLDPQSRVAHILQVRLPAPVVPESGDA